jgi:hypothetical protein
LSCEDEDFERLRFRAGDGEKRGSQDCGDVFHDLIPKTEVESQLAEIDTVF